MREIYMRRRNIYEKERKYICLSMYILTLDIMNRRLMRAIYLANKLFTRVHVIDEIKHQQPPRYQQTTTNTRHGKLIQNIY